MFQPGYYRFFITACWSKDVTLVFSEKGELMHSFDHGEEAKLGKHYHDPDNNDTYFITPVIIYSVCHE